MSAPSFPIPAQPAAIDHMLASARLELDYAMGALAAAAREAQAAAASIAADAESGNLSTNWLESKAARVTVAIEQARAAGQLVQRLSYLANCTAVAS